MDKSYKKLSIAFVIICLSFLWTLFRLEFLRNKNEKLNQEVVHQKKQIDSLASEIFTLELKLFRLECAHEIFEEKNPKASSQLSDIISDETE